MRPLRPPRPPGAALLLIGLASAGELACHADAVAPPPSYAYDVERYALVGEFDWDQARLNATLEVALTLDAAAPPVVTLDSAVTEVTAVRAADGDDLPFFVDADAHQLTIDTAGAARGGDALVLHIEYAATAGESLRATLPRVGDPVAVTVGVPDGTGVAVGCGVGVRVGVPATRVRCVRLAKAERAPVRRIATRSSKSAAAKLGG